jgi:hypothetical protein
VKKIREGRLKGKRGIIPDGFGERMIYNVTSTKNQSFVSMSAAKMNVSDENAREGGSRLQKECKWKSKCA